MFNKEKSEGFIRAVGEDFDPFAEMQERLSALEDRVSELESQKMKRPIGPVKAISLRYEKIVADIEALEPNQSLHIECEEEKKATTGSCVYQRCQKKGLLIKTFATNNGVMFIRLA